MKHLLSSITLLLLSTLAFGQVPNTFSSGETISSSKINANFAYLADGILKDNVTAMMVCQAEGFTESGVYYYASCYSSDDQTFEGTVSLKIKSTRIYPGSSIANFFESTTFIRAKIYIIIGNWKQTPIHIIKFIVNCTNEPILISGSEISPPK